VEENWNEIYNCSIEPALVKLRYVTGVILGFHSVIDGIKRIDGAEVEGVLKANPNLKREVVAKLDAVPIEINSPADMLAGFLHSFAAGRSFRMVIRKESVFHWILEHFGYDRLKLGGTSGCMANSLAPLGLKKILVYANPLTKQLLELFSPSDNLFVATEADDEIQLKHPHQACQREDIEAMHWGMEYSQGSQIKIDEQTLTAPRTNRFYPCWNPVNDKLQLSEVFKRAVLHNLEEFSHIIVAGYQLLSPEYPDGTTHTDYILPTVEFLKELKNNKPELKIHLEFDTIPSEKIRKGIVEYVLPNVDSFGLNEVELDYIIKDMRGEKVGKLGGIGSVEYYLQGLIELADLTGVNRIHFHNLGYYVCLVRSPEEAPEQPKNAMILAATIAARRALTGDVTGDVNFEQIRDIPFSLEGMEQMRSLATHISAPSDFCETGLAEYRGYRVIFLPTKVVEHPALTVGLGDTISAVAFLAE